MKGEFNYSVYCDGVTYEYGTGGIHACGNPGVYSSTTEQVIMDCDVSSLYPSIAVQYDLYPEHLGLEFCKVYKDEIVDVRLREKAKKKKGDKAIIEGFKAASNIVFGKSNSKWSFLYDTEYSLKTTVNGQLFLTLLIDRFLTIPSLKVLQANTDGVTVMLNRTDVDQYYKICKGWENKTRLQLEYKEYKKMVIANVNNYCSEDIDGDKKYKGLFEIEKEMWKDHSYRIIAQAVSDYFFEGAEVEKTIRSCKDIFDFCGFFRTTRGWKIHSEDPFTKEIKEQQKSIRYYVSKEGTFLYKQHEDGRQVIIENRRLCRMFNRYEKLKDYKIDYNFYSEMASRIVQSVEGNKEGKQTSLF